MANAYIKAARALRELEPGHPLRGAFKAVLIALADRANTNGQSWAGHKLIAADAGCTERTVVRVMPVLESAGLLKRDHRANPQGGRKSDLVTLLFSIEKTESQKDIASDNPATSAPTSQKDILTEPKGHGVRATTLNPQEPSEEKPSLRSGDAPHAARRAQRVQPVRDARTTPELVGAVARWWPGTRGPGGDLAGSMRAMRERLLSGRLTPALLVHLTELFDPYAEEWRDRHAGHPAPVTLEVFLDAAEAIPIWMKWEGLTGDERRAAVDRGVPQVDVGAPPGELVAELYAYNRSAFASASSMTGCQAETEDERLAREIPY